MKNNQIRLKDIIGYGTGGVGENIAGNLFYTYFIFFLTSVAGINPAVAGTISLFAVAWDAISIRSSVISTTDIRAICWEGILGNGLPLW